MGTAIIVQARMNSTRLPGKVMKPVLSRPLLAYLVERLEAVEHADDVVIATTYNLHDLPIVTFCEDEGVPFFQGKENDVLARYHDAADFFEADTIVRVTSDCPLVDPKVIDEAIQLFRGTNKKYDYVSNIQRRTFPRGMDVEVFSFDALSDAFQNATNPAEREHVTPFLYHQPEKFRLGALTQEPDESAWRWTVDTPEDFALISEMITTLYPEKPLFHLEDMRELVKNRPDLAHINAHVAQKSL